MLGQCVSLAVNTRILLVVFKERTANNFLTLAKHPSLLPNMVLKPSLFRDVAWRRLFVGSWLSPTNAATSQKSENLDYTAAET